ncbi:protein adenylyltransferase SelO [Thalassotalea sp. ND16A]|uniref:protein adenylyltransferase SelO n=1 Tax=Thalassotalea sp. ND16A TaxID=1535422 RepID=UPI00051D9BEF|nr:YdiU family protein [Thalassotalea sp. ND16A]KGJ98048.1 hypothetical protein ND16A_0853 [Thalassotalea sp. ND16A]
MMKYSNTYIKLGDAFFQRIEPATVAEPKLQLWNKDLAASLQLSSDECQDKHKLAQVFSGNELADSAEPIALAYAGHQFGHFNPQLGDGRAHLLGEVIDNENIRRDIQLKGSGRTHFSRQGDGRCALGPAIREYIMSEAMYALGVPTSRCLAVVTTGENVIREVALPGAVVTRVASSHIRVGTFQYFAARGDIESLLSLADYTIARHYSDITDDTTERFVQLLERVIEKQIQLIVQWLRVGFIHGVMNTDNTAICGETIDFGPCAMMGVYDPATVFSSIDRNGRYAFGNQAKIAQWNMARFAEALLPLIDCVQDSAVKRVEPLIINFSTQYEQAFNTMLANKLGFAHPDDADIEHLKELLIIMHKNSLDYTQTFTQLTNSFEQADIADKLKATLGSWYDSWQAKLCAANIDFAAAKQLMQHHNPLLIPRNHHVEEVLDKCQESGNSDAAEHYLRFLRSPYNAQNGMAYFQQADAEADENYHTFCGT